MVELGRESLLTLAPVLRADSDLKSLQLNAQEGFIISQVDGLTPAGVLCDLLAMDETTLIIALLRLEKLGVVRWARRNTGPKGVRQSADERVIADSVAEDPALTEACDLSRDERLLILKAEGSLAGTHWEVLGIGGDATGAEVKRAYFVASKSFHPDRFFGRDLGSFRGRLDKIFRGVKLAYDTLSREESRKSYHAAHPPPVELNQKSEGISGAVQSPAPSSTRATTVPRGESADDKAARLEKRRQQILEERRSKRLSKHASSAGQAAGGRKRKAEEIYQLGLAQLNRGNVFAAVASFKLAMTYDETNERYQNAFAEANGGALLERARQVAGEAEDAVASGKSGDAGRLFSRAFEMVPHRAEYAVRAAEQLLAAGKTSEALRFATQAVEVSPNRPSAHVAKAAVLENTGDLRAALVALEKAQTLDASDSHVTKSIKRLMKRLR